MKAKKTGRPSGYTEQIAAKVCERIATSSDGLRQICKELGLTPSAVYRWLQERPEFQEQYARAREAQCQLLADEIVEIADTPEEGTVRKQDAKGVETRTGDMLEHRRLRVDARKWILAKLQPHKYGDKQEVSGPNGGAVQVQLVSSIARPKR
ncbi:MAG: terminase small subunit protein [Candidatus Acidiferrales bacterium]